MLRRTLQSKVTTRSGGNGFRLTQRPSQRTASAFLFFALLVVIAVEYSGLGNHIPFLKTIRLTTILSYSLFLIVITRVGLGDIVARPQAKILMALTIMTALSMVWAVVATYALESIRPMIDYCVFLIIVVSLTDRPTRFDAVSWVFAAICCFLVATNFGKLTSGLRTYIFEAAYFMGDGNDFAWGLVVSLPLILNLVLGDRPLSTRIVGMLGVACCMFGIIGSSSRGATLGLAASVGFYWLVLSRRKMLGAIAIAGVVAVVLLFAPSTYLQRMQTVSDYQSDSSAQGRLQVWGAAIHMALDHPFGVGAGNFSSAYGRFYKPPAEKSAISWASGRWLSAHSIYFRVLGEYGFLGLALLILLIWHNIRDNLRSYRTFVAAGATAPIAPTWPALLNMSIVGYAVCGIFLGGLSYPHIFLLTALTISTARLALSAPKPSVTTAARRRPLRLHKPRQPDSRIVLLWRRRLGYN